MYRFPAPGQRLFLVREVVADDDADALEELGDRIAVLAAHIHAATHQLLSLVADFDRRRGWELAGHRSCAHWLAFRTGVDLATAREKVRVARTLAGLPETSASMARGELSFSKVRALTRVASEANEVDLLEVDRGCTTAQLERIVMYIVRGRLDPEVGALLLRAIDAAGDALFRAAGPQGEHGRGGEHRSTGGRGSEAERTAVGGPHSQRAAARRRADAIGLMAERAMAAGFGGRRGEAAPISGTRPERYQVMLHVDADTLDPEREPGRSHLEDGTRVSSETSRRLCCDTAVVRVRRAPERSPLDDGSVPDRSVLDVGRRRRTIPPSLRRALEVRDRGCRFPGCGLRFTVAHHVEHWADGGTTSLDNCLLLCRYHHRLVHEGGWRIEWWGEGRPAFVSPRGETLFDGRWRPPTLDGSAQDGKADALVATNRALGVDPDWRTAGARWKRVADIPDAVYFRALEATG